MPHALNSRAAFTLVELAIVLVILGLLIGGVMAGQGLIRNAEIKSVISDFQRYQSAVKQFRDQYNALPGDMPNATNYWGSAGGTGADAACFAVTSTNAATCNGNGDGHIDLNALGNGFGELRHAWKHLVNAGVISGSYNGQDGGTAIGVNSPGSRIAGAGFDLFHSTMNGNWGELFSHDIDGNMLSFGTPQGIARGASLAPDDASSIDSKIDDGKPDTGKLQTDTAFSVNCFTGAYPNAAYATNTQGVKCSFRYAIAK